MSRIKRRRFLIAAGALLGLPIGAVAQSGGKMHRVCLLFSTSSVSTMLGPEPSHPSARALLHSLRALGYEEGRNLIYEPRSLEGKGERLPAIVAELVRLKIDVIVTSGDVLMEAKKVATAVPIPIVSDSLIDPVEIGLVQSLARPGGNITGLTYAADQPKRIQLLKEALPGISRVVFMGTKRSWETPSAEPIRAAARSLNIALSFIELRPGGYDFDTIARNRPDAVFVATTPENFAHRRAIIEFVNKARLPASFGASSYLEVGGLMSYGSNHLDRMRRAGVYADKILRGAKPADLPIEEPSKYELVINLKNAASLGITIPQSVLLRADRVIE